MIDTLKTLWNRAAESNPERKQHDRTLAVAALMVEIMRLDGHLHPAERHAIARALESRFKLPVPEIEALIDNALKEVGEALDLHQFTRQVVRHFPTSERLEILSDLWSVAHADGHIDPYEEQLIRRMADLMGLHHSQFIAAKVTTGSAQQR